MFTGHFSTPLYSIEPSTKGKGKGLFASRNIKAGETILHKDLSKLKSYTLNEIWNDSKLESDHNDYVGHGRYVMDFSPGSYINHSCNPNCIFKHKSIAVKDLIALKDIKKGEELTHDYASGAVDQFEGSGFWTIKCNCGSKNCRKKVTGDFFILPEKLQKKYHPFLPPSIRRRYKDKFEKLQK